jgi:ferredoxin
MTPITITIDGRQTEVEPGQTLLTAAHKLGIEIPTLCFLEKCEPATSCLVCLVNLKTNGQSKLVPSCATKVQPGMIVESETEEVHEARRTALELLLSDHTGDCLSPCHRICPLHLNIPLMIRQIEAGRLDEAIVTVKSALPLPAVLGRLCHHPCENGCRRGTWDQPAAIRDLERHVADSDLQSTRPHLPARHPPSGKRVVIIGAGPVGLAAACGLLQKGHACTIVDRHSEPGGTLRLVDEKLLPKEILSQEIAQIERLGLEFKLALDFGPTVTLEGLLRGFDAILLATGEPGQGEELSFIHEKKASGLTFNPATFQTALPNVFAAGSLVKPIKQIVRAMSEGQTAATCIDQFLSGQVIRRPDKVFSSMMGRVEKSEVELFMNLASDLPRQTPSCGSCAGFTRQEAPAEASRCLHCDCRAAGHCALQSHAQTYGADPNRFREQRRPFEQQLQHGEIIFEPGKCILCGICVQLAEQAREHLGLTFIGRGFNVRVAAPFNRTISDGLRKAAADCVEHCPTGALVFRDQKQPAAPVSEP